MSQEVKKKGALWMRSEGDYVILSIETEKGWVELIRERLDSPFSHIIEPAGIEGRINGTMSVKL
jgi:hypothetical protein